MKKVFYLITLFAIILIACEKNSPQPVDEPINIFLTSSETVFVEKGNNFSFNVLASIVNEPGNIMISPYSLSASLSMLANGAQGETQESILNSLGHSGKSINEVNQFYNKVTKAILSTDPATNLSIANSIWYKDGSSINTQFVQTNSQWYNSKVAGLDFSLPSASNTINQWCSDNTNGLIKDIVSSTSPSDLLYLLNALYFKSYWAKDFDFKEKNTKVASFITDSQQTLNVNMMSNSRPYSFYSDEKLTYVTIPYGNGSFEYIGFLPSEGVSLDEMVNGLKNNAYFEKIMNERQYHSINLKMPKFKFSYEIPLNEILMDLGISIAFNRELADFSNAFSEEELYITMVKQNNYIEVSEKGTEAATVTVIGMETSTLPSTVEFNRPFVFVIREKSTGIILFTGKVGNPVN